MNGIAQLDEIIRKVSAFGDGGTEAIAKEAAPLLEKINKATASAGTSTDGVAWKSKQDGSRALRNAAAAVEAVAIGSKVRLRLVGTATGDQKVQAIQNHYRPILPIAGRVGEPMIGALTEAGRRYFNRSMGR
jgi:hypothetical protein